MSGNYLYTKLIAEKSKFKVLYFLWSKFCLIKVVKCFCGRIESENQFVINKGSSLAKLSNKKYSWLIYSRREIRKSPMLALWLAIADHDIFKLATSFYNFAWTSELNVDIRTKFFFKYKEFIYHLH